jgi:hypothetical protein
MDTKPVDRRALEGSTALPEYGDLGPTEPVLMRLPEATRVYGFSRSALYLMASRKQIVFRKFGKSVLVEVAGLKAAVAALPVAQINIAA